MTITKEQVADLRPGDVVELRYDSYPETVIRGPLHGSTNGTLSVAFLIVRTHGGNPAVGDDLTVISRAPRPLYVNHDREKPVPGDVVRDADSDDVRSWSYADPKLTGEFCWRNTCRNGWCRRSDLPDRLRLLVDGETGRCVPGQPAGDPLAHIAKGDPTPEGADEYLTCGARSRGWACTRKPDHVGQHIAGCGIGNPVAAVWS